MKLLSRSVFPTFFGLFTFVVAAFLGFFHPKKTIVGDALVPYAHLQDQQVVELSGLVASERYPGVFWGHPDSDNAPNLYAISLQGEVKTIALDEVTLLDWETITRCGDKLYLGEMGNNLSASRALGLYELREPDPESTTRLSPERFIRVRYPEQVTFPPNDAWHYDCEASFCDDQTIYFVTKNRPAYRVYIQDGSADLYKLDLSSLDQDNVLTQVDQADGLGGWVTAADLSPDGEWLAVLVESPVQSIWLFRRPEQGDRWLTQASEKKRYVFHNGGQLESLAFTAEGTLLMINEQREMFRVQMEAFQKVSDTP